MTTKHLSGYYPGGYTLSAHYSKLVIEETAHVGGTGVDCPSAATLINQGSVYGYGGGIYMEAGGSLINGSAKNTSASISSGFYSGDGVLALGAATIANFGTIASGFYGDGVALDAGGSITNGSVRDTTALIAGYDGVFALGAVASIVNFGTIASGGAYAAGVSLGLSGSLTNGSALDPAALIIGYYGVVASSATGSVVNFGTIEGTGGVSVALNDASGEVIAEAGSTFIGTIEGGGGTLALAGGGTGTITNLGSGGTLTGAVEAEFLDFGSVVVEAGGAWTLTGSNTLDADAVVVDRGTLINRGALTVSGTLSIEASGVFRLAGGQISAGPTGADRIVDDGLMVKNPGTGTITVGAHMFDRGIVEVAAGTLDFTNRLFGAGDAATLALESPKSFGATISGFQSGDTIDLLAITATGASVNDDDQLVIVDQARPVATLQLTGAYGGVTFTTGSDGHGGTNIEIAAADRGRSPSVQTMAAAMAAMSAPTSGTIFERGLATHRTLWLAAPFVQLK
jgi:hypothetical protein